MATAPEVAAVLSAKAGVVAGGPLDYYGRQTALAVGYGPSDSSHAAYGGMAPIAGKEQQAQGEGGEDDGSLSQSGSQLGTESLESMDSLAAADYHVVEHSPQGRYVRFNAPLDGGCYKEVWKAYDTSEGVEVAWHTLPLTDIPALDKKRIIQEIKVLEKVRKVHASAVSGVSSSWVENWWLGR